MLTQERPPLDRDAYRTRYDEAVAEINPIRGGRLTTEFYAKTGDAVFNAGCAALETTTPAQKGCTRCLRLREPERPRFHTRLSQR